MADLFIANHKIKILLKTNFAKELATNVWPQQIGWLWCLSRNLNVIRESTHPKRFDSPITQN